MTLELLAKILHAKIDGSDHIYEAMDLTHRVMEVVREMRSRLAQSESRYDLAGAEDLEEWSDTLEGKCDPKQ